MAIAITLQTYLESAGIEYELVNCRHHRGQDGWYLSDDVPRRQLAKAVLLQDSKSYLIAVVPEHHRVDVGAIGSQLGRAVALAGKDGMPGLFADCEFGAITALGQPYGVEVLVDDALEDQSDIYFQAGSHQELVHVDGRDFSTLMSQSAHGSFSELELSDAVDVKVHELMI